LPESYENGNLIPQVIQNFIQAISEDDFDDMNKVYDQVYGGFTDDPPIIGDIIAVIE
jgi:hypothetical protein